MLPDRGRLQVSTDLHGNLADFERLRSSFERLLEHHGGREPVHWILLGDLVHGPTPEAAARDPERFGYVDESPALVEAVLELRRRCPDRVHVVLGNHDYGHVGGPVTRKFHTDEVAALEARMTNDAVARMRELFAGALLAAVAPCGLMFCHGSPDERLTSLELLDAIDVGGPEPTPAQRGVLATLLTSYGQRGPVTERMLRQVSRPGLELRVVVHGHDMDPAGWYVEHGNQACPVLFGAPAPERRYLVVDLARRYERAEDLRLGHEVRRVYAASRATRAS